MLSATDDNQALFGILKRLEMASDRQYSSYALCTNPRVGLLLYVLRFNLNLYLLCRASIRELTADAVALLHCTVGELVVRVYWLQN